MFDKLAKFVNDAIIKTVENIVTDILNSAFELISTLILKMDKLDQYFDYTIYLKYIYVLAGSLLVLYVAKDILGYMAGDSKEKSIGTYVKDIIMAGALIFILPMSIPYFFLPLNKALINLITSIGIRFDAGSVYSIQGILKTATTSWTMVLIILVLAIGFFILGIIAGIRYIELIIAIYIGALIAPTYVKSSEKVEVWLREVIPIVFTQSIHILLLQILATILGSVFGIAGLLLSIGVLVVMFRGPQVLRKYTYSAGVGSATVSGVGQAGRLSAMKFMMKR